MMDEIAGRKHSIKERQERRKSMLKREESALVALVECLELRETIVRELREDADWALWRKAAERVFGKGS